MRRWKISPMEEPHAREYLAWEYTPPYEFYNTPPDASADCLAEILAPNGLDYYAVLEAGCLFGMFEYSFPNGIMEIGLGIRPVSTGRGEGRTFLRRCLEFGRERYQYSGAVTLQVADFNRRAIHLYRAAGFETAGSREAVSHGRPVRFLQMRLEKGTGI